MQRRELSTSAASVAATAGLRSCVTTAAQAQGKPPQAGSD